MFNPKRLWMVLSSALTLGVAGVLVLAGTAPGASALRAVANNLTVAAQAAGGVGVVSITITPTASLTAKLAVTTSVSYTCDPVGGGTLTSNVVVQVVERSGKNVAHGTGMSNGTPICDNLTVNHATVVVIPDTFFNTSVPFKRGTALATVNVSACSTVVVSGSTGGCDFGSAGPTTISIK